MYKQAYKSHRHPGAKHCGRGHWASHVQNMQHGMGGMYPPVNIQELDDAYHIELFAPGRAKEDFKLSLSNDLLTVSAEAKTDESMADQQWARREFKNSRGFKRHFELNEKIDSTKISASYDQGILLIKLMKKEGEETLRTSIKVD
jgi:HSP20 family protein